MLENYSEPEDLLSDESFLSWYFNTSPGEEKDWDRWMALSPDRQELVHEAVRLLDTTRIPERELTGQQVMAAEASLMDKIVRLQAAPPARTVPLLSRRRWIAAACILLLLATGLFITKTFLPGRPQLSSGFGQIREQRLPDGTDVVINANSRVTYSSDWKDGADREVWISGEAFFHVRKTPMKSRFIVHTDHFDIIVTGTQFNVVNRHGLDNVMLQEGKVVIHSPDGRELYMAPGDFVEYNHDELEKKQVKKDSVLSWKEQKLEFDKTPLPELVRIIKDQYGVNVQLVEDSIKDKTISGILPNNNLDVLLQALEATSEFEVVRQDGGIIIKGHSQQN
jgi:transmembrane sensor